MLSSATNLDATAFATGAEVLNLLDGMAAFDCAASLITGVMLTNRLHS